MLVNRRLLFSVLLLLLSHFCQGQNKMIAPSQPIIAAVGSNVVLPCQLDPVKDLEAVAVEWARHDLKPRYIHIRRDGIDLLVDQNSLYLGRTALSDRKLKYGDMSLELSRVKLSDNGTYRCYVPQMDTGAEVQLRVVSVSSPSVSLTKDHTGAAVLKCESRGWYPEPELSWLDSEGNTLAAGRTESLGALEELYSVSSKVTVEQSHGSTLTCRVSESSTKQSRETQINVADEFLVVPSCSVIRFLVSLVACLFVMTVVLICLWKLTKTKTADPKTADPEIGEREVLIKLIEKTQSLDKEQQSEELQRIEKELEDVQYLFNNLSDIRTDQLKHKEKLSNWIHQIQTWINQEKKRSIALVTFNKEKKLEEKNKHVEELETTLDEYTKMMDDINNQMKATDKMIMKTTERKGKLERDKEQMQKLLKELKKRQEEEAARAETQRLLEENQKAENESEKVKAQEQTDEIQEKMEDGHNEAKTSNN